MSCTLSLPLLSRGRSRQRLRSRRSYVVQGSSISAFLLDPTYCRSNRSFHSEQLGVRNAQASDSADYKEKRQGSRQAAPHPLLVHCFYLEHMIDGWVRGHNFIYRHPGPVFQKKAPITDVRLFLSFQTLLALNTILGKYLWWRKKILIFFEPEQLIRCRKFICEVYWLIPTSISTHWLGRRIILSGFLDTWTTTSWGFWRRFGE